MKRKLLALLLVFTMLGVSVFAGLTTSLAAEENLLSHLNNYDAFKTFNSTWDYSLPNGDTSHMDMSLTNIYKVTLPNGEEFYSVRWAVNKTKEGHTLLMYDKAKSVALQKNHKYTMSFWVRAVNTDLTVAMYTKTSATVNQKYASNPYSNDSIRSDVEHTWYVNDGTDTKQLAKGNSSLVTVPNSSLAANPGDWVQIVHTFQTGSTAAYEAYAAYQIQFPAVAGADVQVAGFKMFTEEIEGVKSYTPAVNDNTLGLVSEDVSILDGQPAEIFAEAFGDNVFEGWYVGDELVSTDLKYTFTYDSTNPPKYEARFTAGPSVIDGHYEKATTGQVAKLGASVGAANWTDGSFLASTKDNIHYVDDTEGGMNWRNVTVSSDKAHTGSKSLKLFGSNAAAGRKLTGLKPNSKYVASVYAYVENTGTNSKIPKLNKAIVTTTDKSAFKKPGTALAVKEASDDGVLGYADISTLDAIGKWQKIEVEFITGNFTEVLLWTYVSGGTNNMVNLYLDNYALKQLPLTFQAQSNATAFGTVTPDEEMEVSAGQEITVEATPLTPYNEFEGWYAGATRVSTEKVFTFNYIAEYAKLTAKFKSYGGGLENHDMEGYAANDVLASYDADKAEGERFTSTGPWRVDTTYRDSDKASMANKLVVTSERAHTGEKSVKHNIPYRYIGYDLKNLKTNTDYVFSFSGYITGSNDGSEKTINKLYAVPTSKDLIVLYNGKYQLNENNAVAKAPDKVECFNKWERAELEFNTKGNTDITIWISYEGNGANLYIDDLSIYEPIKAGFSAGLGGDVKANVANGNIMSGTNIKLTAIPYEGNTFVGWTDAAGNLVSTDAVFNFVATESFSYIAKFEGPNMPVIDLLASQGIDGTFESQPENSKMPGWSAAHKTDASSWASYKVTSALAYEGSHSLAVNARFRTSKFLMSGLSPYSTYRLSFYVNAPDSGSTFDLSNFYITDQGSTLAEEVGVTYASLGKLEGGSGWNRLDMYFSTTSNTSAALLFYYKTDIANGNEALLFFDNFHLYAYDANDEFTNGDFENGKTGWVGDGAVVAENGNNALKLEQGEIVSNKLNVKDYTSYDISFKAKGKGTSAVLDLAKTDVNVKNYLTSVSYADVDGDTWTEYTYQVFTSAHKAINLSFVGGENGLVIDDVVVKESATNAGAIVEKIDFESDRFMLSNNSSNAFSIYTGNDDNVYSGSKSLKFSYSDINVALEQLLGEGYLSYQPQKDGNVMVSLKLKIAEGRNGGAVAAAPDYSGLYGADTGFDHIASTNGWNTISFYINNDTYAAFKVKIGAIANVTISDFYIDDIVIAITPPMVLEENSKSSYCEELYNAVENSNFESKVTNNDWKNLPATVKVVKGDARKGSYFLRASAGTKYVLPVQVIAGKEYTFGASVRGNAKTDASIGIALDENASEFYVNRQGKTASAIRFDSSKSGWDRSGFKFYADASGIAYLYIDVKSGVLDVDSVMLFTSNYGYSYDPNDYTVYVPYDYDNLKSETTVINGGFGDQPYYDPSASNGTEGGTSPSTGDSLAIPAVTIAVAFLASAVLLLMRKRKEGAENA